MVGTTVLWHSFRLSSYLSEGLQNPDFLPVKRRPPGYLLPFLGAQEGQLVENAAVIGLLYPCIDRHLGEPHKFKREWSSVMRCVAVFVGINHASAKVDFDNNIQLSLTLAALSIGLWWTFDRSRSGFGLGVGIAFLATVVTQLLVYNGVYQYTSPDFLYVRSWLPCIFFAGGITMGNIGRQLALYECKVIAEKSHQE
ncbi:insulin-induced gene 2 protein isoform X2 [Elephas maximus indicus]|uniref:insulin-induced gene 2 protein isoform X2 n=1 Tax=Elephas maximus indicus TaxID=99487 RepID=UPI002115D395|nr:insulin-induced gene 2 protein isoform X2 [Elephas maximus indicus]